MSKPNLKHKTKVGGQALIEGVMMCGAKVIAMAVRLPDGEIDVETWPVSEQKFLSVIKKIPFVRGIFNMISSLILGYRCLMKSAEKSGMDLEDAPAETKFEKWLEAKCGDNLFKIVGIVGMVLGVALSVVLFMLLPSLAVFGLDKLLPIGIFKGIFEGLIKISLFVGYLALISKMPDIHRVFQYHGAEHKTIACFEAGLPLTPENAKKQSRLHPRCGTNFLFLVLFISILVFSMVSWDNPLVRTALKLCLMPVVIGCAYEVIRLVGRYDNWLTRIIAAPGLQLQKLTTKEPDESQLEVAIAAVLPTLPENLEEDQW